MHCNKEVLFDHLVGAHVGRHQCCRFADLLSMTPLLLNRAARAGAASPPIAPSFAAE